MMFFELTDATEQHPKRASDVIPVFSKTFFCFCVYIRVNQALQFDGVDDHVLLPSIHNLGLTDRYCGCNYIPWPMVNSISPLPVNSQLSTGLPLTSWDLYKVSVYLFKGH